MPYEAHLEVVWDAAGMGSDPCLVRVEDDPNLASPVVGLLAGLLAVLKVPSVACDEGSAVLTPLAHGLKGARPRPSSR